MQALNELTDLLNASSEESIGRSGPDTAKREAVALAPGSLYAALCSPGVADDMQTVTVLERVLSAPPPVSAASTSSSSSSSAASSLLASLSQSPLCVDTHQHKSYMSYYRTVKYYAEVFGKLVDGTHLHMPITSVVVYLLANALVD